MARKETEIRVEVTMVPACWIVTQGWVRDGFQPTVRVWRIASLHASRAAAESEAARLGRGWFVLEWHFETGVQE